MAMMSAAGSKESDLTVPRSGYGVEGTQEQMQELSITLPREKIGDLTYGEIDPRASALVSLTVSVISVLSGLVVSDILQSMFWTLHYLYVGVRFELLTNSFGTILL